MRNNKLFQTALRSSLTARLKRVTDKTESGGIIRGMLLGTVGGVTRRTRAEFNRLGITHLLVVSGLHVAALFAATQWLLSNGLWFFNAPFMLVRFIPLIGGLLTVWVYVLVLGYPVSAVRAAVAITLYSLSSRGNTSFSTKIAQTLLIIISIWPGVWEELGFQLTFTALYSILAIKKISKTLQLARVQTAILFAVFPSVSTSLVLNFALNRFSELAPVGNVLLSPILIVTGFYGGLVLFTFSFVSHALTQLLMQVIHFCISTQIYYVHQCLTWFDEQTIVKLLVILSVWGSTTLCLSQIAVRIYHLPRAEPK